MRVKMQARQVIALVIVVAIIALALGTTIGYSISSGKTTTTSLTTQTIVKTPSNSTGELYELRFNQTGICHPALYSIPWSVTLSNGMTIEEPQGNNTQCCGVSPTFANYSSIVFSVTNGNYSYVDRIDNFNASGNVTVNGKDVTVLLSEEIASCGPTVTSSSNSVPSYSMNETSVSTVNSTLGLSLQLYLPSCDSLVCPGRLDIMASVVNIRNDSNNVTDQDNWQYPPSSLNPYSPCGAGQVGFGIFQGYYDESNFSKAISLTLYNESTLYSCTTMTIVNSSEVFSFEPQSDLVQVTNSSGAPFFNSSISVSELIGGYWMGQIGTGTYQTFPSGTYTIIAG